MIAYLIDPAELTERTLTVDWPPPEELIEMAEGASRRVVWRLLLATGESAIYASGGS